MPKLKTLRFEDYDFFVKSSVMSSELNFDKCNQIIEIHGFTKLRRLNRRKDLVLEALSAIDEFMNPNRSTLNETQISANSDDCLSMDEVSADLDALQWRDFIDDEDNDNGSANMEKVYPRRGRRVKRRKVFDPVHLTKPRSKMAQRRRIFSGGGGRARGACRSSSRVHKRNGIWSQEIRYEDGIYIGSSSLSKTPADGNWTESDESN
ncbi:uncharacterized protein [Spinacia oleracea]|uniref:Uncharacterized protein isoform X1 n=1 Tax=Spinacia oleracea TaxID=3562 RepID=A0ABM3RGH7_SPIOL|nr:uncharacterized protein LOC110791834 isoform X1 [Spinacia oleracea]